MDIELEKMTHYEYRKYIAKKMISKERYTLSQIQEVSGLGMEEVMLFKGLQNKIVE